MFKSWKTTIAGALVNIAYFYFSLMQAGGITTKDALIMTGLGAVSTLAKDFNATGK